MSRTEDIHPEYIANAISDLQDQGQANLSYALLRDYRDEKHLSDEELVGIFETIVDAGNTGAATALLRTGTEWVEDIPGDYLQSD